MRGRRKQEKERNATECARGAFSGHQAIVSSTVAGSFRAQWDPTAGRLGSLAPPRPAITILWSLKEMELGGQSQGECTGSHTHSLLVSDCDRPSYLSLLSTGHTDRTHAPQQVPLNSKICDCD